MSLPRTLKGIKERVKIIGDTITGALKINKTLIVDGDALFNANTIMKGILKVGVNYGDEGGEIRLEASPDTPEENGIVLDQCDSKFRIYGIQSADGITKTGVGTPLIIDPYNKLFDGNYNINANKIISKDTLLIDRGEWNQIILNTINTNKKTYLQSGNIDNDLQDFTISNFYDMTNSKRNSFTFRTSSQGGVRANDLFIYDHVAGKTYMVYGQHNKPTPAEIGAIRLDNRMNDAAYSHNVLGIIDISGNPMLELKNGSNSLLLKYNISSKRLQMDESNDGGKSWHQVKINDMILANSLKIKHDNYTFYSALADYEQSTELRSSKMDGTNNYSALILYNNTNSGGTRITYRQVADGSSKEDMILHSGNCFNYPSKYTISVSEVYSSATRNVNLRTFMENNANIHKTAEYGEMNLYRFFASPDESLYASYNYPCVDQHVMSFSIDGNNHWIRLLSFDIRSSNIYTTSRCASTWGNWDMLYGTQNVTSGTGSASIAVEKGIYIKY